MQKTDKQFIFLFGLGARNSEGSATMRAVLGLRGAYLADMAQNGFPVPAGFTISTEVCAYFHKHNGQWPAGLQEQLKTSLRRIETATGKLFGDAKNPLLLSVRCDAAVFMPGLMDGVLNIGLNDQIVEGFCERVGNARIGWEAYARLMETFGLLIMPVRGKLARRDFELERSKLKDKYGVAHDAELSAAHLRELCDLYRQLILVRTKAPFPQQPAEQLRIMVNAALASWASERAETYRRAQKEIGLLGAAVNISGMVFGHLNEESGVGRASTRDGVSGASRSVGWYQINTQGPCREGGVGCGRELHEMAREKSPVWKKTYESLMEVMLKLEQHFQHPQELEFVVESGKLCLLQTLPARSSGHAAIRWAVEMATGQDIVTGKPLPRIFKPEEALQTISVSDYEQFLFPHFSGGAEKQANRIYEGVGVLPGVASGRLVFSGEKLKEWRKKDRDAGYILVIRADSACPRPLIASAQGVLVCGDSLREPSVRLAHYKGLGCVRVPASALRDDRRLLLGSRLLNEGDWISLDGFTGALYEGVLPVEYGILPRKGRRAKPQNEWRWLYKQISSWSDRYRRLAVRVIAEDPGDVELARRLGAQGVGLVDMDRLLDKAEAGKIIGEYLGTESLSVREKALSRLQLLLRSMVEGLLKGTDGIPLAVCLARTPLERVGSAGERARDRHPLKEDRLEELAGARLLYLRPDFLRCQVQALAEAAILVEKKNGRVPLEILIPGLISRPEYEALARQTRTVMDTLIKDKKSRVRYTVGPLIDTPWATLLAETMTEAADFLAVDAHALTRSCLGIDGASARSFLPHYVSEKLLSADPFQQLDMDGVGPLIESAVRRSREAKPGLSCGLLGEPATDMASIKLCYKTGVEWMACVPCRVPIARFLAAQGALKA